MQSSAYAVYREANRYLEEELIRIDPPPDPLARTRREWMEALLPRLDHPERAYGAIHVAATSGKGSIAIMIAESLRAAGIHVGLHVSPYLQVSTEKLWVDGLYASAAELAALAAWIRPHAEALRGPHTPLHGMAQVAIALEHFRRSGVELAVIETGVGGRDDLTNVLETRVAVVGAIGLDHLKTLGPDLASIARHKAGIIRAGCRALVLAGAGVEAAAAQARAVSAPLRIVQPDVGAVLGLAMGGRFQQLNAALAAAAVRELGDARIDEPAIAEGLRRARLPARMERLDPRVTGLPCTLLLDGAHNPDKLAALAGSLERPDGQLRILFGALASHAHDEALARLAARAARVVLCEPRVHAKPPRAAHELAAVVSAAGATAILEADPARALERAADEAAPEDLLLVTGSLYLCGAIRDRFIPPARVVEARSSWPEPELTGS